MRAMPLTITRDVAIDDLIRACPKVVGLLVEEGLPCVLCGEPFWGTLAELAAGKNLDETAVESLVQKIRRQCEND
jgi:hypothetical protein